MRPMISITGINYKYGEVKFKLVSYERVNTIDPKTGLEDDDKYYLQNVSAYQPPCEYSIDITTEMYVWQNYVRKYKGYEKIETPFKEFFIGSLQVKLFQKILEIGANNDKWNNDNTYAYFDAEYAATDITELLLNLPYEFE
jgi:hypothetical protein